MFLRNQIGIFVMSFITLTAVKAGSKYYDGEIRPYEFGYSVKDHQHRQEKKDENGIITGDFGFITGDGAYHSSAFETDGNGDFKLLSFRTSYKNEQSASTASATPATNSRDSKALVIFSPPVKACSNCKVIEKDNFDRSSPIAPDPVAVTAHIAANIAIDGIKTAEEIKSNLKETAAQSKSTNSGEKPAQLQSQYVLNTAPSGTKSNTNKYIADDIIGRSQIGTDKEYPSGHKIYNDGTAHIAANIAIDGIKTAEEIKSNVKETAAQSKSTSSGEKPAQLQTQYDVNNAPSGRKSNTNQYVTDEIIGRSQIGKDEEYTSGHETYNDATAHIAADITIDGIKTAEEIKSNVKETAAQSKSTNSGEIPAQLQFQYVVNNTQSGRSQIGKYEEHPRGHKTYNDATAHIAADIAIEGIKTAEEIKSKVKETSAQGQSTISGEKPAILQSQYVVNNAPSGTKSKTNKYITDDIISRSKIGNDVEYPSGHKTYNYANAHIAANIAFDGIKTAEEIKSNVKETAAQSKSTNSGEKTPQLQTQYVVNAAPSGRSQISEDGKHPSGHKTYNDATAHIAANIAIDGIKTAEEIKSNVKETAAQSKSTNSGEKPAQLQSQYVVNTAPSGKSQIGKYGKHPSGHQTYNDATAHIAENIAIEGIKTAEEIKSKVKETASQSKSTKSGEKPAQLQSQYVANNASSGRISNTNKYVTDEIIGRSQIGKVEEHLSGHKTYNDATAHIAANVAIDGIKTAEDIKLKVKETAAQSKSKTSSEKPAQLQSQYVVNNAPSSRISNTNKYVTEQIIGRSQIGKVEEHPSGHKTYHDATGHIAANIAIDGIKTAEEIKSNIKETAAQSKSTNSGEIPAQLQSQYVVNNTQSGTKSNTNKYVTDVIIGRSQIGKDEEHPRGHKTYNDATAHIAANIGIEGIKTAEEIKSKVTETASQSKSTASGEKPAQWQSQYVLNNAPSGRSQIGKDGNNPSGHKTYNVATAHIAANIAIDGIKTAEEIKSNIKETAAQSKSTNSGEKPAQLQSQYVVNNAPSGRISNTNKYVTDEIIGRSQIGKVEEHPSGHKTYSDATTHIAANIAIDGIKTAEEIKSNVKETAAQSKSTNSGEKPAQLQSQYVVNTAPSGKSQIGKYGKHPSGHQTYSDATAHIAENIAIEGIKTAEEIKSKVKETASQSKSTKSGEKPAQLQSQYVVNNAPSGRISNTNKYVTDEIIGRSQIGKVEEHPSGHKTYSDATAHIAANIAIDGIKTAEEIKSKVKETTAQSKSTNFGEKPAQLQSQYVVNNAPSGRIPNTNKYVTDKIIGRSQIGKVEEHPSGHKTYNDATAHIVANIANEGIKTAEEIKSKVKEITAPSKSTNLGEKPAQLQSQYVVNDAPSGKSQIGKVEEHPSGHKTYNDATAHIAANIAIDGIKTAEEIKSKVKETAPQSNSTTSGETPAQLQSQYVVNNAQSGRSQIQLQAQYYINNAPSGRKSNTNKYVTDDIIGRSQIGKYEEHPIGHKTYNDARAHIAANIAIDGTETAEKIKLKVKETAAQSKSTTSGEKPAQWQSQYVLNNTQSGRSQIGKDGKQPSGHQTYNDATAHIATNIAIKGIKTAEEIKSKVKETAAQSKSTTSGEKPAQWQSEFVLNNAPSGRISNTNKYVTDEIIGRSQIGQVEGHPSGHKTYNDATAHIAANIAIEGIKTAEEIKSKVKETASQSKSTNSGEKPAKWQSQYVLNNAPSGRISNTNKYVTEQIIGRSQIGKVEEHPSRHKTYNDPTAHIAANIAIEGIKTAEEIKSKVKETAAQSKSTTSGEKPAQLQSQYVVNNAPSGKISNTNKYVTDEIIGRSQIGKVEEHPSGHTTYSDATAHIAANIAIGGIKTAEEITSKVKETAAQSKSTTSGEKPAQLQSQYVVNNAPSGRISNTNKYVTEQIIGRSQIGKVEEHPSGHKTYNDATGHIAANIAIDGIKTAEEIKSNIKETAAQSKSTNSGEIPAQLQSQYVVDNTQSGTKSNTNKYVTDVIIGRSQIGKDEEHPRGHKTYSDATAHIAANIAIDGIKTAEEIKSNIKETAAQSKSTNSGEIPAQLQSQYVVDNTQSGTKSNTNKYVTDVIIGRSQIGKDEEHPRGHKTYNDATAHIAVNIGIEGIKTAEEIKSKVKETAAQSKSTNSGEIPAQLQSQYVVDNTQSGTKSNTNKYVTDVIIGRSQIGKDEEHPRGHKTYNDATAHIAVNIGIEGIKTAEEIKSKVTETASQSKSTASGEKPAQWQSQYVLNNAPSGRSQIGKDGNNPSGHKTYNDATAHIAANIAIDGIKTAEEIKSNIKETAAQSKSTNSGEKPAQLQSQYVVNNAPSGRISNTNKYVTDEIIGRSQIGKVEEHPSGHKTYSDATAHIAANIAIDGIKTAEEIKSKVKETAAQSKSTASGEKPAQLQSQYVVNNAPSGRISNTNKYVTDEIIGRSQIGKVEEHPSGHKTYSDATAHIAANIAIDGIKTAEEITSKVKETAAQSKSTTSGEKPAQLQSEYVVNNAPSGRISNTNKYVTDEIIGRSQIGKVEEHPSGHKTYSDATAHIAANIAIDGIKTAEEIKSNIKETAAQSKSTNSGEIPAQLQSQYVVDNTQSGTKSNTNKYVTDVIIGRSQIGKDEEHPRGHKTYNDATAHISANIGIEGIKTAEEIKSKVTETASQSKSTASGEKPAQWQSQYVLNNAPSGRSQIGKDGNNPSGHRTYNDATAHIAANIAIDGIKTAEEIKSNIKETAAQSKSTNSGEKPAQLQSQYVVNNAPSGRISNTNKYVTDEIIGRSKIGKVEEHPSGHKTYSDATAHIAANVAIDGIETAEEIKLKIKETAAQSKSTTSGEKPAQWQSQYVLNNAPSGRSQIGKDGNHPSGHKTYNDATAHIAANIAIDGIKTAEEITSKVKETAAQSKSTTSGEKPAQWQSQHVLNNAPSGRSQIGKDGKHPSGHQTYNDATAHIAANIDIEAIKTAEEIKSNIKETAAQSKSTNSGEIPAQLQSQYVVNNAQSGTKSNTNKYVTDVIIGRSQIGKDEEHPRGHKIYNDATAHIAANIAIKAIKTAEEIKSNVKETAAQSKSTISGEKPPQVEFKNVVNDAVPGTKFNRNLQIVNEDANQRTAKTLQLQNSELSSKKAVEESMEDMLYRFNYTAGYHGHSEEGNRAGNKVGEYFIVGGDNIRRGVAYVANGDGFMPVVKYEKVSPAEAPQEDTEANKSLRGYEFEWFHKGRSKRDSNLIN